MAYYVETKNRVYAFATRKDAFMYVCDSITREGTRRWVYKDRACKVPAYNIEYVGWGTYNCYNGNNLSWVKGETPKSVNPKTGEVYNPFTKRE